MKSRILVVADDASQRALFARWLIAAGYAVELAEGAKRAREVIAASDVALAILAPERIPEDLAGEISDSIGRLILIGEPAQLGGLASNVSALPKNLTEQDLLERIQAILRDHPKQGTRESPDPLRFEGYLLDVAGHTCRDIDGKEVPLTRAEFALLVALAQQPGKVLSRDALAQAMAGRDTEPDDRSVDVLISRLRRKIEPVPKTPRLIVTVPGAGYKFAATSQTAATAGAHDVETRPARVVAPTGERAIAQEPVARPERHSGLVAPRSQAAPRATLVAALAVAVVTVLLAAFWFIRPASQHASVPSSRLPQFDAAVIPLVNDQARKQLASYLERPDVKALAISGAPGEGWAIAFGAADAGSAKNEALERCRARAAPRICHIYAVGKDVLWTPAKLPMPMAADLHAEPLGIPLSVDDIPMLTEAGRKEVREKYLSSSQSRALVLQSGHYSYNTGGSRAEAQRLAIERCGEARQTPCLLISVDGMLTVQIPRLHRPRDIFMLTSDLEIPPHDKEIVAKVYQQQDWRALVRGERGWYPVANLPSEAAAVEAAQVLCGERDRTCRLYAIGNFRVSPEN